MVSKYHSKYLKELGVKHSIEAYIQSQVLKRTLEAVSFERRRGILDGIEVENAIERLEDADTGAIHA